MFVKFVTFATDFKKKGMKKLKGCAQVTDEGTFIFQPYASGGDKRYSVKKAVAHGGLLETQNDYILKIKISKTEKRIIDLFIKETTEAVSCLVM